MSSRTSGSVLAAKPSSMSNHEVSPASAFFLQKGFHLFLKEIFIWHQKNEGRSDLELFQTNDNVSNVNLFHLLNQ